jgi:hypothetical protein
LNFLTFSKWHEEDLATLQACMNNSGRCGKLEKAKSPEMTAFTLLLVTSLRLYRVLIIIS